MFNKEQNQYLALNYHIDVVYNALINGISTLSGFSIIQADQINHVIGISKGPSLFTWGENIMISLKVNQATNQTYVYFSSDSKLGTEFAAKKQNRKNIEKITNAMNMFLMQQPQHQIYAEQMPQQGMYQGVPTQMPQQNMNPAPAQQMVNNGQQRNPLNDNMNNM